MPKYAPKIQEIACRRHNIYPFDDVLSGKIVRNDTIGFEILGGERNPQNPNSPFPPKKILQKFREQREMVKFDIIVFTCAVKMCEYLEEIGDLFPSRIITVNISRETFRSKKFADFLIEQYPGEEVPITLELLEEIEPEDIEASCHHGLLRAILERKITVNVAVDDFVVDKNYQISHDRHQTEFPPNNSRMLFESLMARGIYPNILKVAKIHPEKTEETLLYILKAIRKNPTLRIILEGIEEVSELSALRRQIQEIRDKMIQAGENILPFLWERILVQGYVHNNKPCALRMCRPNV